MSLYNLLFGTNAAADFLLATLNLKRDDFGRFRDCFPNQEGTRIIVHTRCGGGNREYYQWLFEEMSKHPNYISNADEDFDCTYCDFVFSVPEKFKNTVKAISEITDKTSPPEKWTKLMDDLKNKEQTPEVARAMEVGKQLFDALNVKENGQK